MKQALLLFFSLLLSYTASAQTEVVIDGTYNGENLMIVNPFSADGVGFCIQEIRINNKLFNDNIFASNIIIDFKTLGLQKGEKVHVSILHKKGSTPQIQNPEAIKAKNNDKGNKVNIVNWEGNSTAGGSNSKINLSNSKTISTVVQGKVINERTGKAISNVNIFLGLKNDAIASLISPSLVDTTFLLPLTNGYNYEVSFEPDSNLFYKKKIAIDLRDIPENEQTKSIINVEIKLAPQESKSIDSLLTQFAVAKLHYDHSSKKLSWDDDYSNAIKQATKSMSDRAKKDKEVELLQQQKKENQIALEQQRIFLSFAGVIVFITIAFSFFIFRSYKQKKKANELIAEQKAILEEKQKEILDSIHYAQRIQRAQLPTEKYIQKNLNRLKK